MEEVLFSYTRQQAIKDGVLVDVSEIAKEMGYKFPVAVTSAVWQGLIVPPPDVEHFQDVSGRLWDTLWMLRHAIKSGGDGSSVEFSVLYEMGPRDRQRVTLKSICGPGDNAEPVITVMFPEED